MGTAKAVKETFTREQLAESKKYKKKRDLLYALLEDGKAYTVADVDKMVNGYMGRKVE